MVYCGLRQHQYWLDGAREATITEITITRHAAPGSAVGITVGSTVDSTVGSDNRILIIGPSWVGDMVMAQSLFTSLKTQQPDTPIDVLAPAWSQPILERMPEVAATIAMPVGHGALSLGERWRLGRSLRMRGYRQAIVLPNSLKSALIPFFAAIPRRTGWRGEMRYGLLNDVRVLDKARYPLMIERFAALAYDNDAALPPQQPWPQLVASPELAAAARQQFDLNDNSPVLALCPGAEFGPSKRWPERHYAAVAQAMIAAGWQVWLFGSTNDRAVCEAIRESLPQALRDHCHDLAGKTALAQAIDLLSVADAVVSNDSGLMHVAAALGRSLVVLYGSTSPGFTPPLTKAVEVLSIPVDCGPCFQRECPLRHHKCLEDIGADRVLAALQRLVVGAAG